MGETTSESENPASAETATGENESQAATAGENVLTLLRRASDLAGANSRYAVEMAQRMSNQLWAAQKKGGGVGTSGDRVGS